MYSIKNNIRLLCLCITAMSAATGCDSREADSLTCLIEGYWVQEDAPQTPMLNFSASGHLFYYIYSPSGETGYYDACYDTASQAYTKYAVDMANGRICFLPDQWYDIKVITPTTLTLGADEQVIKFTKIDPADVHMLSVEEYFSQHPAQKPEN